MSGAVVRSRTEAGVAIVAIDHPPVNALAQPVRSALLEAVLAAEADPAVRAILIHGVGRHFVAGADIREFDAAPRAPLLNDVLLRIEAVAKPVIAALNGTALGGGLELALASHYRCAVPAAALGLPEVKLGLLPGSGGTQRLPRLIGAPAALELMLSGAPIDARRGLELGILDRLLDGADPVAAARAFAAELIAGQAPPRRLCERRIEPASVAAGFFAEQRARALSANPGLLAPGYIVDCVEAAVHEPFATALARSRRLFEECRDSPGSRSLRHLFFAERGSHVAGEPRPVRRVAVIGAGTMGGGIAISLATSGHEVVLIDADAAALERARGRITSAIQGAAAKGRLSAADAAAAIARVAVAAELAAAASAELVIEAVFESLSVKQDVFRQLDRLCAADAVLATNTSTLDVDAIAGATHRPARVVGMHFFSPANVMRLVELVRGRATAPGALATALAVTRRMGKLGIVVGNGFGFVGNRMLYAYGHQNQLMLLEGASPASVDAALKRFGMAMGPNEVGDLAGLDVGYRIRREWAGRPSDPRYYRVADVLVEAGRLGQKSGKGYYRYEPGARGAIPDPEVEALIAEQSRRLGIARREISDEEIVERCLLALVNEGARLLGEGIAASAADIDAIWCNGYGFPRWRGGPMFYADTRGITEVAAGVGRLAREQGGDLGVAPVLAELAASGGSFALQDRERAASRPRGVNA